MTLCQLVKAIDDFNGKFGIGGVGDVFLEVKNCRLSIRHFRHVKKRAKAKKALTRLRTITNKLIRELQRKLPTHSLFDVFIMTGYANNDVCVFG
jgi:IS5 family transposase